MSSSAQTNIEIQTVLIHESIYPWLRGMHLYLSILSSMMGADYCIDESKQEATPVRENDIDAIICLIEISSH